MKIKSGHRSVMAFLLVMAFSSATSGCAAAQAWWHRLQTDPVSALGDGISVLRTAGMAAQAAFGIWEASADPQTAANARVQFNQVMGRINDGISTAQDGLHLAADLQQANPNTDALLNDARSGASDLSHLLSGLTPPPGRAVSPEMARAVMLTQRASTYHVGHSAARTAL